MTEKRLFSIKDACNYLGVSRMTLLTSESKGLIRPSRTPGGHRRYTLEMLEEFLQSNRNNYEERKFMSHAQNSFVLPQFVSQLSGQPASQEAHLNEALRNLVLLLQVEIGAVFLVTEKGRLQLHASFGIPRWRHKDLMILGDQSIAADVLHRRQPLVYAGPLGDIPLDMEGGQGICAPLIYQNKALGVVHVISMYRYQFFPSEINILTTITVYLASLIANSQLLAQQQVLLKELSLLNRISQDMETRTELDPMLETFLDETLAMMDADRGIVFLRDSAKEQLYVRAAKGYPKEVYQIGLPEGEGITSWVIEHGQPRLSSRLADDPLFSKRGVFLAEKIVSNICLPLRSAGETIGAFHISRHVARAFGQDEIHFLATVGNQAAVIIRRAILLEEASKLAQVEYSLRDYYEMVVESLPVGLVVVNADFKVELWNSVMEQMTQVKREDAIGCDPCEIFPPMDKGWEQLKEVLRTGQPKTVSAYEHMTPEGKLGVCEAQIIPVQDADGILTEAVFYVREM
jgi:PAS domain S-box-containing protein/excisionase family DNA binding protein